MKCSRLRVPGWGYPADWWKTACGRQGQLWSFGYYEETQEWLLEKNYYWIIAHSFGFYMLPKEVREKAHAIIWYGSFFETPKFSQETWLAYAKDPETVQHKFITNMFSPHPSKELPPSRTHALLRDVQKLALFDYTRFWREEDFLLSKIIYVHGSEDRITPHIPPGEDTIILQGEGHMPNSPRGFNTCIQQIIGE